MKRKISICSVSLHSYPIVEPTAEGGFGGTETRAWTISQGLARHTDVEVSLVVRNPALTNTRAVENVMIVPKREFLYWAKQSILNSVAVQAGFPFVKIKSWNWNLPFHAGVLVVLLPFEKLTSRTPRPHAVYTALNCDVYLAFGVHYESARVIASAKSIGRKSVLFLGADTDIDERFQPNSLYRTQYRERASVCHYALTEADMIVAQTTFQQTRLREVFNLESVVMANPIDRVQWMTNDPREWSEEPLKGVPFDEYVLWIGRADTFHKRPHLLVEIARQVPDIPFLMVMNPRDENVETRITSEKPPNVHVISEANYHQMPALFQRAKIFVSTSDPQFEGFPNTFLQAAATDTPIVSLDVGQQFLGETNAGIYASGDMNRVREAIKDYWNNRTENNEKQKRTHDYLDDYHDVDKLTRELIEQVSSLLQK